MSERHNVILLFYDLPTVSSGDKKAGTEFRKNLIRSGYQRIQKSVYVKLVRNSRTINTELANLRKILPQNGDVKALSISLNEFQSLISLTGEAFNMKIFADDMVVI